MSYKILNSASIYTAECFALLHTISKICEVNNGEFDIFSDSESALRALSNTNCKFDSPPCLKNSRENSSEISREISRQNLT